MTTLPSPVLICPNGHGSPAFASARFCAQCGAPFVTAPPPNMAVPGPMPTPPVTPAPMNPYQPANGLPAGQNWPPPQQGGFAPQPPPPGYPQPQPQGYPPPQQGYPGQSQPQTVVGPAVSFCPICGGDGSKLSPDVLVCPQCRWLRPLAPGYTVLPAAFQWGADAIAMAKLRSIGPLMAAARTVSDKVGRRWVETSFNAVRLGDNQLPEIYARSIQAARLLGMPFMPDIYVSGDKMWDAVTYGTDRSAFVLLGSALINNYKGDDLLYLLAREMGHCRAGHALWKTVGAFLVGAQGPQKGLMSEGIIAALNPERLVHGAIEMPFLAWARQAEITADRAGMLAVGDEETARRVLLSWSLRSVPLYRQINIEAWLQQQEDSDDQMTRISEMLSSPTPYITRRLKLLTQFAGSPDLAQLRSVISPLQKASNPVVSAPSIPTPATQSVGQRPASPTAPASGTPVPPDILRVSCPTCGTGMRVPRSELAGKDVFRVKCPNAQCGKVLTLQKKSAPAPPAPADSMDTE